MNKVLIIGAKGMLGHYLMVTFRDLKPVGVDKEELDITDEKMVEKFIFDLRPDLIINAAAYTDVDGCETNKDLAMKVNGYAVGYLARAAEKIGAVSVHYSTDYVFDGQKPDGYKENDEPANPINVYGESKFLGEKLLKENCQKYYLIRTSWLFGRHGKNFVDTILKFGKEKEELKVVNDQRGKPTYTVDLAKRTKELIDGQYSFGIYHITNEGATTWYDYTLKIFEVFKSLHPEQELAKVSPCTSVEFPRPAKRPAWSILINTKVPPSQPWPKAVEEYLKN